MHNTVVVPRAFQESTVFDLLEFDGISCVNYYHPHNVVKRTVFITAYIFVVVLSGRKVLHTPKGDFVIEAGNAFFSQKDSYLYSEFIPEDDRYDSIIFFMDDSFLSGFLSKNPCLQDNRAINGRGSGLFQIEITPLFRTAIESISPYFTNETSYAGQLMRLKFEEILLHIAASDEGSDFLYFLNTIYSNRRRDLVHLMESSYTEPLRVDEFARMSGRSLSAFKKDFILTFNQSPKQWINSKRLELAYNLLSTTDKNVTEVCFDVGFENVAYFSQLFKKNYGISPSSCKKPESIKK